MFTAEELQAIDTEYFRMIVMDPYDLTIQSKCTGHYWYLHSAGYPSDGSCIIFHKHRLCQEICVSLFYSSNSAFILAL